MLDGLPARAELHENRHYALLGLGCAPLAAAVRSGQLALDLLDRLRCR